MLETCAASFENLIENAPPGIRPAGSGLDVRMYPLNGRMVVDVVDCGPGIPSEYLGRVFREILPRWLVSTRSAVVLGCQSHWQPPGEKRHVLSSLINRQRHLWTDLPGFIFSTAT